jgi:hypothetical protein
MIKSTAATSRVIKAKDLMIRHQQNKCLLKKAALPSHSLLQRKEAGNLQQLRQRTISRRPKVMAKQENNLMVMRKSD